MTENEQLEMIGIINRQKAEIERLENNISAMAITLSNSARATGHEAVKEFAERLKEKVRINNLGGGFVYSWEIDNLVKEMVGESK